MKCSKCKEDKDVIYFGKNKSTATGYQSWCKECRKLHVQGIKQPSIPEERVKVVEKSVDIPKKKSSTDYTAVNEYAKEILPLLIQYRSNSSTVEELGTDALFLAELIVFNNDTYIQSE